MQQVQILLTTDLISEFDPKNVQGLLVGQWFTLSTHSQLADASLQLGRWSLIYPTHQFQIVGQ